MNLPAFLIVLVVCGEIGMFTTVEHPEVGDNLFAETFFRLDGSVFVAGDWCICGHCGQEMKNICIDWIDYEDPRDA